MSCIEGMGGLKVFHCIAQNDTLNLLIYYKISLVLLKGKVVQRIVVFAFYALSSTLIQIISIKMNRCIDTYLSYSSKIFCISESVILALNTSVFTTK